MHAREHDIELPPAGPRLAIDSAFPSIFNWDYKLDHPELVRLYEKGKALQWNATTDIDWSVDVDPERERIGDREVLRSDPSTARKIGARRSAPHEPSYECLDALAVYARRAGRVTRDCTNRQYRAVDGGEVLRRQPGGR